jgi:hypothetical protein
MSIFSRREKEAPKPQPANRRRSARLPPRPGISCSIVEGVEASGTPARVIDVSQTGVRILSPVRYENDSFLHVTLSNAADLFSYSAVVVVRYAVGSADGQHITGCEFLQPLSYENLRALLA